MSYFNTLNKIRRQRERVETLPYQLVRLTKAGRPNQMIPARGFASHSDAVCEAARIRSYNPGQTMRYAVNGQEV